MTPMTDTNDPTAERGHGAYRATHHPHRASAVDAKPLPYRQLTETNPIA